MSPAPLAIVFDLDGTLVDSRRDIAAAANHALTLRGYPALPLDEVAAAVGDGARVLLARLSREAPESAAVDALLQAFLPYYTAHAADATRLMPGAAEALVALRALPLALCTNKPRDTTNALLRALKIESLFSAVIGGGDLARLKPDPMPLAVIAQQFGLQASELAIVGDGPQDILCGRAAGSLTIGVLGGIAREAALRNAAPDLLLASLWELPPALAALGS